MFRSKETLVGIIGALVLAGILITLNTLRRNHYLSRDMLMYAKFKNTGGLVARQPVRVSGQQVGEVVRMFKNHPAEEWIYVEMKVEKGTAVPKTATAYVLDGSGVGLSAAELHFEFTGICEGDACMGNGDTVQGREKLFSDIISASTLASFDPIFAQLGNIDSVSLMIEGLRQTMASANGQISGLSSKLRGTLSSARGSTDNLVGQNAKISALLKNLATMTEQVKGKKFDATLQQAHVSIRQLSEKLEGMDPVLLKADSAALKLNNSLVGLLENPQLKRLFDDPTMPDSLQMQIKQIDSLLVDIRLNPKKYLRLGKKGKIKEVDFKSPYNN